MHKSFFFFFFLLFFLEHLNYLGIDERFGPIALSLKREKLDDNTSLLKPGESEGNQYQYRIIVRTSEVCMYITIMIILFYRYLINPLKREKISDTVSCSYF